jgi:hypothetical protein
MGNAATYLTPAFAASPRIRERKENEFQQGPESNCLCHKQEIAVSPRDGVSLAFHLFLALRTPSAIDLDILTHPIPMPHA